LVQNIPSIGWLVFFAVGQKVELKPHDLRVADKMAAALSVLMPLELRIPAESPLEVYERYLAGVREALGLGEVAVVVNLLQDPPTTMPIDPAW
jgi:hypothetical protein